MVDSREGNSSLDSSGTFSVVPYRRHRIAIEADIQDTREPVPSHRKSVLFFTNKATTDDKRQPNKVALIVLPFFSL